MTDFIHIPKHKIKEDGINFLMKRGTFYDKLQHEEYFRIYDRNTRQDYGIAKVQECVVVAFKDIVPQMVFLQDMDTLLKDMLDEHHNFHDHEIVTLIYFTVHHKYETRERGNG
jgi:hypothetical protein